MLAVQRDGDGTNLVLDGAVTVRADDVAWPWAAMATVIEHELSIACKRFISTLMRNRLQSQSICLWWSLWL